MGKFYSPSALNSFAKNTIRDVFDSGESVSVMAPAGVWLVLYRLLEGFDTELRDSLCRKVFGLDWGAVQSQSRVIFDDLKGLLSEGAWVSEKSESGGFLYDWVFGKSVIGAPLSVEVPTIEELNQWVSDTTHGLITEFPVDASFLNPDAFSLLLANIIYQKLRWGTAFKPNSGGVVFEDSDINLKLPMSALNFAVDEHNNEYAVIDLPVEGESSEFTLFVPLGDVPDEELAVVPYSRLSPIFLENVSLTEMLKVTQSSDGSFVRLWTKEWEQEETTNITELPAITEIVDAIATKYGEIFDVSLLQKVKTVFNKEGFEGAAATALVFATRSIIVPKYETVHVDITKKFAYISRVGETPVFGGVVKF